MKRIYIISFVLCLVFCDQAQAQRYLSGQKGLQVTASSVDGYLFNNSQDEAFSFGLALSKYTKNQNRMVFGIEYLEKQYPYKDITIPVSQFTAEGGYYLMFLSNPSKVVFFSVGASVISGYETSNWGDKLLFDGATILTKDAFIYGGSVGFEIETFITDRIVFLANIRERVLFGSETGKFHTQIGCGLKFIIN